ncbi:MAG: hypothetical protein GXP56_04565 [Deltaproteobacteria bacterium]|nr:hypothetical protein [Deltaproteobacteria bacterium]
MNRNYFKLIVIICASQMIRLGIATAEPMPASLVVTPKTVAVDTFFSGGKLSVSGDIPSADDVIIEVTGKDSKNLFDLKGKMGPFWMTRGKVHIDNVPGLYILLLPEGRDWGKKIKALGIGFSRLKSRMTTSGPQDIPPEIFKMFIKLKKFQSLYGELKDAVTYAPGSNDKKHFTAVLNLPSSIAQGDYTVRATTIANNDVGAVTTREFSVEEVGFIKFVNHMASDRRVLYGVSAVIIALLAGLIMGVVFKQSGGSH